MSDSQSDSEIFSVRIVSIDYYMAPPIPGADICYSSFHGGKAMEVPVIRVYGSTPAGQKTCLHIHRALPYLYVPCSDIPLQLDQEGCAYTYKVAASLEKALQLKGGAGSTRQHVHGCSLVRARRFYGYHSFEELFVKIYLYYPQDVSRAATLLLAGTVLDRSLQPHESHIPFILQFLVDYNLYGMGHLHLSKMMFRLPMPDSSHKKLSIDSQPMMADSGADTCLESKTWISSTVPSDWMWSTAGEFGASSNDKPCCPKRQSTCELEGDASVDEILNQQFKMYSSLSQTCSDVKMVQSLVPIWEEQQKRTGVHEATVPPDSGKPLPEDVMKPLSVGLDFEKKLLELCSEAGTTVSLTPSQKELRETDIIGSSTPPYSLSQDAKLHEEGTDKSLKLLTVDEMQSSELIGMLDIKDEMEPKGISAVDREAQHLLKWLATSQAADDINSDDELVCETILSPLLPAATMEKVLEEANMAYESESQKECQDILDSIDEMLELELSKEKPSWSSDNSHPVEGSRIPQVDGSADDEFSIPCASLAGTSSAVETNSESKSPSEYHVLQDKRSKQWGSLPFSITDKVNNREEHATLHVTHPFESQTGESADSDYLIRNGVRNSTCITRIVGKSASGSKEQKLVNCSLRDLMRRKRSYQMEQTEYKSGTTKKLLIDRHEGPNTRLWKKQLDLETMQTKEEETELLKNCDLKVSNHDNLVCAKLPLPDSNDGPLLARPKDEYFGQNEMEGLEASTALRNSANQSSLMGRALGLSKPENLYSSDSIDPFEACKGKNCNAGSAYAKPVFSDTPNSFSDVQFLRKDTSHKIRAPERFRQTHSAASSSVQFSSIDDTNTVSKDKSSKQWGSLPFSMTKKVNNKEEHATLHVTCPFQSQTEESADSDYLIRNGVRNSDCTTRTAGKSASESKEQSLRDLMRQKRSYRIEQTECKSGTTKKLLIDRHEGPNTSLWKKQLEFETMQIDEEETELLKNCDLKVSNHDNLVCAKLPLPDSNDGPLLARPKDEYFGQNEIEGQEASTVLRNSTNQCSLTGRAPGLSKLENLYSSDYIDHLEACTAYAKPVSSGTPNAMGKSATSGTRVFLSESVDNQKCGENTLCETNCSEPIVDDLKGNHMKLTGITIGKKTPLADKNLESNLSLPATSNTCFHLDEESYDEMSGNALDDFLPISTKYSWKEMENCVKIKARRSHGTKDVATHYQNDGSHLYLLTPNILPPSVDCVHRWLSRDERDQMCQETDAEAKDVPECASGPPFRPKLCDDASAEKKPPCISGGKTESVKVNLDGSQDHSQISGPIRKSSSTPLSQIGFRDPASVGCGQQLTLLSIEVLAESRGDLSPDPRFDGINIVVLAFQNDSDSIVEVLVLLHSKLEPCQRSSDGLSGCKVLVFSDEKHLLKEFIKIVSSSDPDVLMGWDIQGCSLGYLAERASHIGLGLLNSLSRTPSDPWVASEDIKTSEKGILELDGPDTPSVDCCVQESSIIEDEWGRTHASGVHVGGRIVLNVWRMIRGEVKLNLYSVEAVAEAVLRRKIPLIHNKSLTKWFSSGPGLARYQCIKYVVERAKLNLEILNQLDMVNRTSELARVFGIDFFSVLSRGSQYRVESMFLRLAHTQNYLAISPGNQQVASQPAMECLPLVMEPESGFYSDPVVVFDFQSLYPSMIIAYNLCFCTCVGKVVASKANTLGVSSFSPEQHVLRDLMDQILLTPNGVMFVPSKVRRGVLPRLLEEILSTRIMVKQALKQLAPSEQILQRIFNSRQLALKLISNVTYGYTAAGFSGRMPCAELADSIVQCGRSTLEKAISFVNLHEKWNARVIYGDTDSMFVLLKGRTIKESFQIGSEIASAITAMNPSPVTLKMEKVYHGCFLLTKKRYVGYSYESPDQIKPVFDAKGIETVRRDTCGAVAKIMEQSLRLFFEHQDLLEVKTYLQRQWKRILSGRFSLKDFVFAKEVRLGTYSARISSLPPAAIVATKAMRVDPRAEPRYAERIPYVVIHGEPGARLSDMVVDPLEVLAIDSPFRINDLYYINKQIIPALQRVFGLLGADLNLWFSEMPRPIREASAKHAFSSNHHRTRIDYYYLSKHCILCGGLVQASAHLCNQCSENGAAAATAVISKTSKLEQEMQHLVAICHHCGGGDRLLESGVKCTSIACSVFYERRKVQKELLAATHVAADKGFYPRCRVEWF